MITVSRLCPSCGKECEMTAIRKAFGQGTEYTQIVCPTPCCKTRDQINAAFNRKVE